MALGTQIFIEEEQDSSAAAAPATESTTDSRVTRVHVKGAPAVGDIIAAARTTKEEQRKPRTQQVGGWLDVAVVSGAKPFPAVLAQ